MYTDGSAFLRRARIFFTDLKELKHPNASTLAIADSCSKNTAQRVIARLKEEYLMPLEYNSEKHGYYLLETKYQFPDALPPGKDELAAFIIAKTFLSIINDETLNKKLNELYYDYLSRSLHPQISDELKPINEFFSCDLTAVSQLADWEILPLLHAATLGENIRITYQSPWRHKAEKQYDCRIKKLHYSDGSLYLLIFDSTGVYKTLNAAFIKNYEILENRISFQKETEKEFLGHENWRDGFGIWSGDHLEEIIVKIKAPGSKYYSTQVWHETQEDSWDGDDLIRIIHAIPSPEIERRILSLGRYLLDVEPVELKERLAEQVGIMGEVLKT